MLLDKGLTDLTTGYDTIRNLPLTLLQQWRAPLLQAYAKRHAVYRRQLADHRQRWRRLSLWALLAVIIALADMAVGLLLLNRGSGWGLPLVVLGMAVGGVVAVMWLVVTLRAFPRAPDHPLRPPLRAQLFPALEARWQAALAGDFEGDDDRYGTQGEAAFVQELQARLPDTHVILHGLQLRPGDDVDVVVLGPSGVWAFEVKFWSGTIAWEDGTWRREKTYHERGGAEATEAKDVGQPPDQQWRRMARDVARTLGNGAPWLAARVPDVTRVRGGLVFTSHNSMYQIPEDTPFRWGTARGWSDYLRQIEPLPGMDRYAVLRAADVLLARHQALNPAAPQRSMAQVADDLAAEAVAQLRAWVDLPALAAER